MALLEIRDLHKRFHRDEVLKGIDLDVERGDVICIVGPSGSGKTTLLRCINHLESIDRGEVRLAGELVGYRELPDRTLKEQSERVIAKQRAEIGMVFQRFNLFGHLTALENVIKAPMVVRKVTREEATQRGVALLEQVGLGDRI